MSESDFKNKISNLDSFWDLDSLVVKKGIPKKPTETFSHMPSQSDATKERELADINIVKNTQNSSNTTIKRYIIPKQANVSEKPDKEYSPENSLIHNVKIYSWNADYNYYEDFYRDVKRYFNIEGGEAEHVPFFSYVPQYSQMNRAQSLWYFRFRSAARAGEFIASDYSYILLYCFELINSASLMSAEEVIKQLALIWKNYRKIYPQLNKYLSEWIVDFGLLNGVAFPKDLLGSSLCELMQNSTLKEYYASSVYKDRASFVKLILQFCSAYDHRRSRYYENNAPIYDAFIEKTLEVLFERGLLEGFSTEDCTITRQAFIGALVPYNIKKKIEISYCSFSRTNDFRYVVGDIVKYCENKIRAHLSIKSKLGVFSLDDGIRRHIDALAQQYFAGMQKLRKEKTPSENEYDKLYDVPKKEFSLADAKEIESDSWNITERLIEAFADNSEQEQNLQHAEKAEDISLKTEPLKAEKSESVFAKYKDFLTLVLDGDFRAQRAYAHKRGIMLEALVDEINGISAELFGDVLLEECDGGYAPIEDYISLIEKEVNGNGK